MTNRLSAAALLSRQGMPPGNVSAVLESRDPRVIRRHMELHRERLMEQPIVQHGKTSIRWNGCWSSRVSKDLKEE
jgi:hypothetical protein